MTERVTGRHTVGAAGARVVGHPQLPKKCLVVEVPRGPSRPASADRRHATAQKRSVNPRNHGQLVKSRRRSIFIAARVSAALMITRMK